MTTHIYTVNSTNDRDKLIRIIYNELTKEPSTIFTVAMDGINRIKVMHSSVTIRIYTVLVVPIILNLSTLENFTGHTHYYLDETINSLQRLLDKLCSMQGKHFVKGNSNGQALQQALRELA